MSMTALQTISGEIQSQPLNDNFSLIGQDFNAHLNNIAKVYINVMSPPAPYNELVGDGLTDDITNLLSLISYAESLSDGINKIKLYFPPATYALSDYFTLDSSKICIESSGAILLFTSDTDGIIVSSNGVSGAAYSTKMIPVINGFTLNGIGSGSTKTGIKFDNVVDKMCKILGCNITGFDIPVYYGSNTWLTTFESMNIYGNNQGINFPSGLTNSGEKIMFIDCNIFNQPEALVVNQNNLELSFFNCSFDYLDLSNFIKLNVTCIIRFNNCHLEANVAFPWISISAESICLSMNECFIGGNPATVGTQPFVYTATTFYRTKVIFRDLRYAFSGTRIDLASPTILLQTDNIVGYLNESAFTNNFLDNGNFEAGSAGSTARGWTLTNATVVDSGTTAPYEGSNCLLLSDSTTQTAVQYVDRVRPGDYIDVDCYCKNTAAGKKNFNVLLEFLNYNNETISNISYGSSSTVTDWTYFRLNPASRAPLGTSRIRITFRSNSGWSYYIDNIRISIQ